MKPLMFLGPVLLLNACAHCTPAKVQKGGDSIEVTGQVHGFPAEWLEDPEKHGLPKKRDDKSTKTDHPKH